MFRLFVGAAIFFATSVNAYDDNAVKAQCDAKWGADYAMVAYCRDKQRSAGEIVDQLIDSAQSNETLRTIVQGCISKWEKDYQMVSYCADKQSNALQDLKKSNSDVPESIQNTIMANCKGKWGDDFQMIAYCRDQQETAWRRLQ